MAAARRATDRKRSGLYRKPGPCSPSRQRKTPIEQNGGWVKRCRNGSAPFPRRPQLERGPGRYPGSLIASRLEITVAGQRRTLTGFPFVLWHPGHEHLDRYHIRLVLLYHRWAKLSKRAQTRRVFRNPSGLDLASAWLLPSTGPEACTVWLLLQEKCPEPVDDHRLQPSAPGLVPALSQPGARPGGGRPGDQPLASRDSTGAQLPVSAQAGSRALAC